MNTSPFVISQHPAVLAEVLRRATARDNADRVARMLGFPTRRRTSARRVHVARIGNETIESNLPLR